MALNTERFLVESYPPPPAPSPNLGSGGTYPKNACIFTISVCLHGLQARHRKICKYCPLSQKNSGPFPWAWGKIWFDCERYSNVTSTTNVNYCKKKSLMTNVAWYRSICKKKRMFSAALSHEFHIWLFRRRTKKSLSEDNKLGLTTMFSDFNSTEIRSDSPKFVRPSLKKRWIRWHYLI